MKDKKDLKIALVHDFLTGPGGAERVLEVFCEMFPEAPIYTLLYDKEGMKGKFSSKVIHASFLQKFPKFLKKRKKWLLPFLPVAPEIFDLRDFDVVVSSSGAWSKGIITRLNTVHIAYIHSPMRFAWDVNEEYLMQQKKNRAINFCSRWMLSYIRLWDRVAADRPDFLIANSKYTQERIRKYYGRESEVVYPPIVLGERNSFKEELANEGGRQNYFLVVSRLSPYKKIDSVVEAFNKLGLPLVIIGEGEQEKYLRSIAEKNVHFLGYKTDKELIDYYSKASAFIFSGVDDFGIAPVEAMMHGIPVLALRKGGIKEVVLEGKTGEFFDAATPEVIADGVRRLMENKKNYQKDYIKQRANLFDREWFEREIETLIGKIMDNNLE